MKMTKFACVVSFDHKETKDVIKMTFRKKILFLDPKFFKMAENMWT